MEPGSGLVRDMQVSLVKILWERWIDAIFDAYMLGDGLLLQHEQHLEKCSHSGHRLSVPNIRLDGTDMKGLFGASTLRGCIWGKDIADGLDFNPVRLWSVTLPRVLTRTGHVRIAGLCPRSMHFRIANIERVYPGHVHDLFI